LEGDITKNSSKISFPESRQPISLQELREYEIKNEKKV